MDIQTEKRYGTLSAQHAYGLNFKKSTSIIDINGECVMRMKALFFPNHADKSLDMIISCIKYFNLILFQI